jgi:uncharacterized membrane protein
MLCACHGVIAVIITIMVLGRLSLVVPDRRIERVLSAETGDGE